MNTLEPYSFLVCHVVAFDENQDIKDGGYDIINLQPVNDSHTMLFKHKLVGNWSNGNSI